MKKIIIILIAVIAIAPTLFSQNNFILGAGLGVSYGANEAPVRDVNGAFRINAVLTNAFGSFLSPEIGLSYQKISSESVSSFSSAIYKIDFGLRWYMFQLGDFKPYLYAGLGYGAYNSKYNYWDAEFTTLDGLKEDINNGTNYVSRGVEPNWTPDYANERNRVLAEAGGRDAFYKNGNRKTLNGSISGSTLIIPIGGGITYQLTRDWNFTFSLYQNFTTTDLLNPYLDGVNDSYWAGQMTVNYNFGNIFDNTNNYDQLAYENFEVGTTLNLHTITFEENSSDLDRESVRSLNRLLKTMNANKQIEVKLEGHTDNTGDAATNMSLSLERAIAVKNWLVNHDVSANRITTAGYGDTKPIMPNTEEANKATNRRISIVRTK